MSLRSRHFYVTAPAKGCHAEDPGRNMLQLVEDVRKAATHPKQED